VTEIQVRLLMVASADGASIAVHCTGAGTPLLLVHGALADHTYWDALAPLLLGECELLAVDRRGRGASGDAAEYKYEREVDDLFAAVMAPSTSSGRRLHRDVDAAHSSGAILALRAAECRPP
jgi:pimeloyl-ACP methyl ester carboxylesterase